MIDVSVIVPQMDNKVALVRARLVRVLTSVNAAELALSSAFDAQSIKTRIDDLSQRIEILDGYARYRVLDGAMTYSDWLAEADSIFADLGVLISESGNLTDKLSSLAESFGSEARKTGYVAIAAVGLLLILVIAIRV